MTMAAMVMREHGGPDVLRMEQLDVPVPGPREVRVRVRAVALNHLDIWTRRGGPAFKLTFPHRLGADIAGVVDAVGPGATATVGATTVVSPGLSCGRCAACLGGHDNLCRHYAILGEHVDEVERMRGRRHVGEVALLRDVPRNATLTAKTPMTLLTLEREAFLEAVTGHPQSHERAEAIVEDRLPPQDL
jgi:NADPH:quinone reductase-like Zn-dependent oxidoreductase